MSSTNNTSSGGGCPFFQTTNRDPLADTDQKQSQTEDDASDGVKSPDVCYYHDYLRLDRILNSNKPRSARYDPEGPAHEEHLFITIHQSYELWFKQILYELESCILIMSSEPLENTQLLKVVNRFTRVNSIMSILVDQFNVLDTMTPLDFLDFRRFLFPASGFQSVQFRLLENMLGLHSDIRIRYNGKDYHKTLSKEHASIVQDSENKSTLFDVIERWLERCPFTATKDFNFVDEYSKAVNQALEAEKLLQLDPESAQNYEKTAKETFDIVFNKKSYNELRDNGKIRLSYSAFKAALMIMLYRDVPIYHMPFQILQSVIDLDSYLYKWRNAHSLMVHRMLGAKMGTGGSSGYHYLRTAAIHHRVFADFFNLSTYMIPKRFLPVLPESVAGFMHFSSKLPERPRYSKFGDSKFDLLAGIADKLPQDSNPTGSPHSSDENVTQE